MQPHSARHPGYQPRVPAGSPQGSRDAPGYNAPASPGSPFHLAAPDNDPLPARTRALIVVEEHGTGARPVITWDEIDPARNRVRAAAGSGLASRREPAEGGAP
jgi:hypothetical protein